MKMEIMSQLIINDIENIPVAGRSAIEEITRSAGVECIEKTITCLPSSADLKEILACVCECTNTSMEQVLSKNRYPDIVDVRQVYCYLARMRTGYSFREIGELIGQAHCSVVHSVNRIKDLLQVKDRKIMEIMEKISVKRSVNI
jgi:chromosomal replication initiation ATPase DnaA